MTEKGKWYRNPPVKWGLFILGVVCTAMLAVGLVGTMSCPESIGHLLRSESVDYESTAALGDRMLADSSQALAQLKIRQNFETDGAYDGKKLVDIAEYEKNETISGENKSGLAYRLDDLRAWAEDYDAWESEDDDSPIVVCKKPDQTYQYYYYDDFREMVESGKLRLGELGLLQDLADENVYMDGEGDSLIYDDKGTVVYTEYWNYDGYQFAEQCAPDGAQSLLEIVNSDPRWNGKLEKAFELIDTVLGEIEEQSDTYDHGVEYLEEGNTNLSYLYVDKAEKKLYSNVSEFQDYEQADQYVSQMIASGKYRYVIIQPKLKDSETNLNDASLAVWKDHVQEYGTSEDSFYFAALVDVTYPIQDHYADESGAYNASAHRLGLFLLLGVIGLIGLIVSLVWLSVVAGKEEGDEEIHLNWFDYIWTEIAAGGLIFLGACYIGMFGALLSRYDLNGVVNSLSQQLNSPQIWVGTTVIAAAAGATFYAGWLSLVRRIRAKTIWRDSVLRHVLIWIRRVIRWFMEHVPSMGRLFLIMGIFFLTQWIMWGSFVFVLIGLAAEGILLYRAVCLEKWRREVREGVNRIAHGEVDYKIPTDKMKGDEKEIAEGINQIGDGLDAAVEEGLKNERLKTDLITNVSHDIKTPLTSIINYIDLLKRENLTDPKVVGYLEVLEAKAQRLKTLTEDVVEASKVSSGNVNLNFMKLNLSEMIQQTSGEFSEKFEQRGLKEVLSLPEEPALVSVDGQRMWRVLENIYNNAAKYAMEGTRVYADLKVEENTVVFSLKNISEQQLNISADELTERFIRGDISRSTEGSGLGLSIAKNITELMNGTFEVYLDGDLFRVTITLPKAFG